MQNEYKHPVVRVTIFLSVLAALIMMFFYVEGYETSLGWRLNTETELEEIVAYEFQKGPVTFQLKGEKATLLEAYSGDAIDRLPTLTTAFVLVILLGIALLVSSATYFKQTGFLIFSALFVVFLYLLHLPEYFGTSNWVILAAFVPIIGLAFAFHAYFYNTTFLLRALSITGVVFGLAAFISGNFNAFSNHFLAYSATSLLVVGFVFVAFIAEEILFALLYVLTRTKSPNSNFHHWVILGGLYVANLLGYYLNKAKIVDFSFTFMNPYILLLLSFGVALWSFRYKHTLIEKTILFVPALVGVLSLGLITFSWMGLGFARGLDGIYEAMHYMIIYAHLGFGFLFLLYILYNFIDPLFKGVQVFKVAYKPQGFHYVSARIGGLVAVMAFFSIASKAPLNLVTGVKYNLIGDAQLTDENLDLAITYYKQADAYGYNAHYTNYNLGMALLAKGNTRESMRYFVKATERFPSAQAYLNASNLQPETNTSLASSYLSTGLQYFPNSPELKNNLGLIHLKNNRAQTALEFFDQTISEQSWNQAPEVNKWATFARVRNISATATDETYAQGNLAVKTNILSAQLATGQSANIRFTEDEATNAYPLHRQAYLLNASYVFTDTVLQRLLETEITAQGTGLQMQLRRAMSRNLYLSGDIKRAFQSLDYMQQGMSGYRAGEVFNEMGLLALDQHAPLEAVDFFEKAIQNGYTEAAFNLAIALLEAGKFAAAENQLKSLSESEENQTLISSLVNVFKPGTDTTAIARFNEMYYRGMEWPVAKLKLALKDFTPESQGLILRKIAEELENRGASEAKYQAYGITPPSYEELSVEAVKAQALKRPFDESLILKAGEKMDAFDAHNLYRESLEFNPYSIPLLRAHALSAIDINLPEYAQPSIEQLSQLLSLTDYVAFEREWYQRKANKGSDWPN